MDLTSRTHIHHGVAALGVLAVLAGSPSLPGVPTVPGQGGSGSSSGSNQPAWRSLGHLSSSNGTLRSGCRRHAYHYRVSPPSSDWSLETFLIGPRGGRLASDVVMSGGDPRSGTKWFTICRSNTRPGEFTIKGKLTYSTYPGDRSGWIPSAHFRLSRP